MPGSQVRASHLLVKHNESRNPSNFRGEQITRSREEALKRLVDFREDIVSQKVDFATLAYQVSDCGSAKNGGDLGFFGPGQMMKPFEDATRALRVGEISGPVYTDSGIHIIWRTA